MLIFSMISELLHLTSDHLRFCSDFTKTALAPLPEELQSRVGPLFKAYVSGYKCCHRTQTQKWLRLMTNRVGRRGTQFLEVQLWTLPERPSHARKF